MLKCALTFALVAVGLLGAAPSQAQPTRDPLQATAERLRGRALAGSGAFAIVESLTTEIGPRPAGSPAMDRAYVWAEAMFRSRGFENVRSDEYAITGWIRGDERAEVVGGSGRVGAQPLILTTLVGSVATPARGIEAEVALFPTYDDLLAAPVGSLRGKIAVVTQVMTSNQDGSGYGAAGPIRRSGASEAARRGAVGYLMRSLGTHSHRFPHTGSMRYAEDAPRIPAAALSPPDAEQLERLARRGPVRLKLTLTPTTRRNARARNVIAEVRGRERPDEFVVLGAHLDAWDLGTGAVDDGAGVAIVTAAAKLIADLPTRPRRSIRVVLFGAEEIGEAGPAYAATHAAELPRHVIVSESDFGADRVYGFALPAGSAQAPAMQTLRRVLTPLGVNPAGQPATSGGPDFSPLVPLGVPAFRLQQDGTDYFDFHHTADDTLDKIDPVTLDQNVAAWAATAYLIADSDVDFRALTPVTPRIP